jgi:Mg2+/Co2+ transporter CorC
VNTLLRTNISDERMDTIGGWFLTKIAETEVSAGEEVEEDGCLFTVHAADGYHIKYLEVKKIS